MTKEIWLNLPVKDAKRSKEFFIKLGFEMIEERCNDQMTAMTIGSKKIAVMLFSEQMFKGFAQNEICDTKTGSEVLISFDAESREEIDEIVKRAEAAGANIFGKPSEIQGWMYGCGFADLDGHRWNALYMDMGKMPK